MVWTLAQTPDSYALPSVSVDGAPWLAAAAVTSFTLDRELVSSVIPGNIRTRQGLSVGAASVEVAFEDRVTPWSTDLARRVDVDAPARLFVSDGDDELALGSWVVAPTSGSLTSNGVSIELLEAQSVGKGIPQALPVYDSAPFAAEMPVDPVWVVSRLAEQAGFPATPPPVADALLVAPMDGAATATYQVGPRSPYLVSGDITGWEVLPGDIAVGGSNGSALIATASGDIEGIPILDRLRSGGAIYFTLNVVGTVYLLDVSQGWLIEVVNDFDTGTHTVAVAGDLTTAGDTKTFAPSTDDPAWPNRVTIELLRTWSTSIDQWTQTSVRVRAGSAGAWSAASIDPTDHAPAAYGLEVIAILGGSPMPDTGVPEFPADGQFAAVQVTATVDDAAGLYAAPKAYLKPLGGDMGLPFVPAGVNLWPGIQDICSAWAAAAILGNDGAIRILNRDDLAGATDSGDVIDIGMEWTDLPWSLDPADTVDRVQVTFTPPEVAEADVGSTTLAPIAWRAPDVITVPPNATITIPAAFENLAAVGIFGTFIIPSEPSVRWSQSSNLFPFDNPEGTGSPLSVSAVRAEVLQTSATTALITVRNVTSSPIYLVDGNGEPGLILRARIVATYETPQVIERGQPAETAVRPLEVDLSPWVQSAVEAQEIASYLHSRLSGRGLWKASSVRCRLDWSHDLGQVKRLVHPTSGLEAKALITKVHFDGQPGEIAQTLDLVLLPWTWADFDAMTAATPGMDTWAEFDTAYSAAGRTWQDFDADPLWTGA